MLIMKYLSIFYNKIYKNKMESLLVFPTDEMFIVYTGHWTVDSDNNLASGHQSPAPRTGVVPGLKLGGPEDQEDRVGQDRAGGHQEEEAGPEVLLPHQAGHDVGGVRHQGGREVAEEAGETHESASKVRSQVQRVVPGANVSEPCSTTYRGVSVVSDLSLPVRA